MRILVSCASGSGTSMMMKMKVEQAAKELGIKITNIQHCPIAEGKTSAVNYDIVFCSLNFVDMFSTALKKGVKIVGMKNVLSVEEAKEGFRKAGLA